MRRAREALPGYEGGSWVMYCSRREVVTSESCFLFLRAGCQDVDVGEDVDVQYRGQRVYVLEAREVRLTSRDCWLAD